MTKFKSSIFLVFLVCNYAFAQDSSDIEKRPIHSRVSAAYVFGGQMYNDNFLYNPGFIFSVESNLEFSSEANVGGGIGYMSLQTERFIPIYIDLVSYKKDKKNSGFFNVKFGYSHAWNTETALIENYDFKGGIYLASGLGKKIFISDALSLLFQFSYNHQFARIIYTATTDTDYNQSMSFNLLSLSTSFVL